jgi:hypothetical protein
MTGSGKTGLVTVTVEEALRSKVPVLIIDVKGDLPNLLLTFPTFDPSDLSPWIAASQTDDAPVETVAQTETADRRRELESWGIGQQDLQQFCDSTHFRVLTPGSSSGEMLHVLSSLECPSERWKTDIETARDSLSAAVSLVLRLLGRDPDPTKSKDHVLLSVLAERLLIEGKPAALETLLEDLATPPIERIGALALDAFISKTERKTLAAALNSLLASPTFATWRQGTTLDIGEWLAPKDNRTPAVIVSVAHLDDEERLLVLGVLMQEVLSWVRTLPGAAKLQALVVFDEIYGFMPPHPANPPTKRPLVALMKQARAFGVGVVVATQNPMDLDYRALANAGVWCIGRLQTDADCERVLNSLASDEKVDSGQLAKIVKQLTARWFVMRDLHGTLGTVLLKARTTMSLLRGPMTRNEIKKAREIVAKRQGQSPQPQVESHDKASGEQESKGNRDGEE